MADVGLEGADGAGAAAHRRGGGRAQAGTPGLVDLGFADDLPGYLRDGYENGRLPVLALALKLAVGNGRIKQELDAAVVVRRRPGGSRARPPK